MNMSKKRITRAVDSSRNYERKWIKLLTGTAACMLLVMFVLAGSLIVFPSFAATYASGLPVVKQMVQAQEENDSIVKELEAIKEENEQLKMQIKNIEGEQIKEIQTSEGVPTNENNQIQQLVVRFIKAQYNRNLEAIKEMCTDEFKAQIGNGTNRSDILKEKSGDVVFTQITNVAKEGGKYLVFVRLNDGVFKEDADYQENFELEKVNGQFLVSFVGNDA